MKRLLILAAFYCSAVPAYALDGNKLFDECSREHPATVEDAAASIACNNYIIGVADGVRMTKEGLNSLVIPDHVTGTQLEAIVLKYLKDHPAFRHYPAALLVYEALTEAFPVKP